MRSRDPTLESLDLQSFRIILRHGGGDPDVPLTPRDPTVAIGTELDIIAAVVIGGGSLSGGQGGILGSMVGALTMALLRNGCQQMGWPNYLQEIIVGGVIVLAVSLDVVRTTRRESGKRFWFRSDPTRREK